MPLEPPTPVISDFQEKSTRWAEEAAVPAPSTGGPGTAYPVARARGDEIKQSETSAPTRLVASPMPMSQVFTPGDSEEFEENTAPARPREWPRGVIHNVFFEAILVWPGLWSLALRFMPPTWSMSIIVAALSAGSAVWAIWVLSKAEGIASLEISLEDFVGDVGSLRRLLLSSVISSISLIAMSLLFR